MENFDEFGLKCPEFSNENSLEFTISTGNLELDAKIIQGLNEIKQYCENNTYKITA